MPEVGVESCAEVPDFASVNLITEKKYPRSYPHSPGGTLCLSARLPGKLGAVNEPPGKRAARDGRREGRNGGCGGGAGEPCVGRAAVAAFQCAAVAGGIGKARWPSNCYGCALFKS